MRKANAKANECKSNIEYWRVGDAYRVSAAYPQAPENNLDENFEAQLRPFVRINVITNNLTSRLIIWG